MRTNRNSSVVGSGVGSKQRATGCEHKIVYAKACIAARMRALGLDMYYVWACNQLDPFARPVKPCLLRASVSVETPNGEVRRMTYPSTLKSQTNPKP